MSRGDDACCSCGGCGNEGAGDAARIAKKTRILDLREAILLCLVAWGVIHQLGFDEQPYPPVVDLQSQPSGVQRAAEGQAAEVRCAQVGRCSSWNSKKRICSGHRRVEGE